MRDPRIDVCVVLAQDGGYYATLLREAGCPTTVLGLRGGGDIAGLPRAVDSLKSFDVHHFHGSDALLMLASIMSGGKTRVYTHRGGVFRYGLKKRIKERISGLLLRRYFAGYCGNTRHAATVAAERYGIAPDRFAVIYNGIDFGLLTPRQAPGEIRRALRIPSAVPVVGTSAHLRSCKRIERLIDACSLLGRRDFRLLIVGDGPDRPRLEEHAQAAGISDRVVFAGMQEEIASYLTPVDVFVCPSGPAESFGNSAVEAMALGIPTLVFADGGGLTEHIEDGASGFVVSDEAELAARIGLLLDDPALADVVGKAGLERVRARYQLGRAANEYRTLYSEAIDRGN